MELCFLGFSHYARKILILCFGIRGYTCIFTLLYGVLMEPQSSENCAFFVLASGQWPYMHNKVHVHEYPHIIKVSMHVRGQHGKEKTLILLFIT